MIKRQIKNLIIDASKELFPSLPDSAGTFNVEEPPQGVNADLSSNAAFVFAKPLKKPPKEIAEQIARKIQGRGPVSGAEPTSNGFLNLRLKDSYLHDTVLKIGAAQDILAQDEISQSTQGPVMIEFVSANPTGPLHIGHGRGAALGDSLARIFRARGWKTQTEYYVNDRGFQMEMLANSVKARRSELRNEPVEFPKNGYQGDYIKELAQEMVRQNREDFSDYPRQTILENIRKDLADFRVSFDAWFSERSLYPDKVDHALSALDARQCLQRKEGALWFLSQGEKSDESDKDRVLQKSDGSYTYFASDIAYHKDKFDRGFKLCLDIWGHDHHGYVPRVMAALKMLDVPKDALKILLYQLVSLKREGKRAPMSTRSGEFVTLKEILDEVGPDACRFFFAMRNPNSQLEFDVDLAKKKSKENPVYYVQYVHARISSIFREAEKRGVKMVSSELTAAPAPLLQEERALALKTGCLADVLDLSLQVLSPHPIADYLIELATCFHKFYDKHRVLDAPEPERVFRAALLKAAQKTVKEGLALLGVSAPESM